MEYEIKKPSTLLEIFKQTECVFTCEKHGDVQGYFVSIDGERQYCCPECEKEEREREREEMQKAEVERLKRERYNAYKDLNNIEPEFWEKELTDFVPETEEQKAALEAVKTLITKKSGKVVLLGEHGVGKTFLGCMAVKALGGKILSMYEITTMIRQCYSPRAEMTELEFVHQLASMPMLVIDEMGRTKGSDAELNWLSYILDKRHTRNLPFMILSNTHLVRNCPKKEKGCEMCFERFVNNDVLSRLRQNTTIITIKASDYRAKRG
jgi:hypothetical protein